MIIVTGGAGFIGSNLHAALVARGERPVVVDWLGTEGKWRIQYGEHEFCSLLEGHVRLQSDDGSVVEFRAGDSFMIPSGGRTYPRPTLRPPTRWANNG